MSQSYFQDGSYIGHIRERDVSPRHIVVATVEDERNICYYSHIRFKVLEYLPFYDVYRCELMTADANDGKHFNATPEFMMFTQYCVYT